MRKIHLIFILIGFTIAKDLSAQNKVLDSIKKITSSQEQLMYLTSVMSTQQLSNPEKLFRYANAFDSISKIDNLEKDRISAINFYGMANYANENYDKAIDFYLQAIKKLEQKEPSKRLSQIYNNLAGCYRVRDDFSNTEKYFLKAQQIAKDIDDKPWLANINSNLAVVYMDHKMFEKAAKNYDAALAIYKEADNKLMMGITYMNQGNFYILSEDFEKAKSNYTLAQEFVPFKMVPLLHAVSQTGIGVALTQQKQYRSAKPYLDKGLEIVKEIKHNEQLMETYVALSDYHSQTKDFKNAFLFSNKAQTIKDSINAGQQDKNLANALQKYEAEKKDSQLKVLASEKEQEAKQKAVFGYLALAGVLAATLIGFLLFRNNKKNKLLARQKTLLEATVDEKNVLLKETHHRVKNSFQIVSSLLYLQSENIEDKEAQIAMREAQNRVRSMVLIHQKLYSKDQLVGIDTNEYFTDLIKDIFESNTDETSKIEYTLDVEALVLSIETVTPLGLILNELITNVIKHAFPEDKKDKHLHIILQKNEEILTLEVADNGAGMASEIKDTSFGIKLMKALSKKLKASILFEENKPEGTKAIVNCKRFNEL